MQQRQACHADEQAVGDLVEDDGVGAVGDFGGDFDAPVDRAGGEDQDIVLRAADACAGHAEEVGVLGDAGEEGSPLSLELHTKQVDAVGLCEDIVEVVRDFDPQLVDVGRDEGGRSADDDASSQFFEAPDV